MSNLKVTVTAAATLALGVFLFCWTALHVGSTVSLVASNSSDLAELARVQAVIEIVELTVSSALMLFAFRLFVSAPPAGERAAARRER